MLVKQAVTAIVIGAALVALGVIPGPLAGLMHELQDFQNRLSFRSSLPPVETRERLPGQLWLAALGAGSILIGLLALISG